MVCHTLKKQRVFRPEFICFFFVIQSIRIFANNKGFQRVINVHSIVKLVKYVFLQVILLHCSITAHAQCI